MLLSSINAETNFEAYIKIENFNEKTNYLFR